MRINATVALMILFSFLFTGSAFSQTMSRDLVDEYCKNNWRESPDLCKDFIPEEYHEKTAEKQTIKSNQVTKPISSGLKCPKGTYYGLDNQGKQACRDINTNQIVDPSTGIRYDSQTGAPSFNENQNVYVIVAIIFIIIIIVVAASRRGSSTTTESNYVARRPFSEDVKHATLEKQQGKCAICGEHVSIFQFDHRDGDRSNNSPRNCQAVCPNCHDRKSRGLD